MCYIVIILAGIWPGMFFTATNNSRIMLPRTSYEPVNFLMRLSYSFFAYSAIAVKALVGALQVMGHGIGVSLFNSLRLVFLSILCATDSLFRRSTTICHCLVCTCFLLFVLHLFAGDDVMFFSFGILRSVLALRDGKLHLCLLYFLCLFVFKHAIGGVRMRWVE